MKTLRIFHLIVTAVVAVMMAFAGFSYLFPPAMANTFRHLGYPGYFRIELGIAKIIGSVLLLAPVPRLVKQIVYAGFAFTFISAFIAHVCVGDPVPYRIIPLAFLTILCGSYLAYMRLQRMQQSNHQDHSTYLFNKK